MAGIKRSRDGHIISHETETNVMANSSKAETAVAEPSTPLQSIFETFRNELDEHHDRRERVIKTSRDITALSKKMYVISFLSGVLKSC